MCKAAQATLADLMSAIEPTLVNLLTVLGIADTPNGQAAITAYNAALAAVQTWVPGTDAQDVIQVINAFTDVFNTLPIPADAKSLADVISAGIVVVISVLTGNSPAAPTPDAQKKVQADAIEKVTILVPGYKESLWDKARAALGDHSIAAKEYHSAWKKTATAATAVNPTYAVLEQS
jgi:hypothetical protein